ncbi:MAG: hypothetical protein QOG33_1134 [Gaiellales bacterium]|nr:hypothetical protein [Gaiellales bacterium]
MGSRIALTATTAVLCLLLGVLLGIRAAGGHPRDVLRSFGNVQAAQAENRKAPHAKSATRTVTIATGSSQTTRTVTVSAPPKTVTRTETVTETVGTTTPPPTTTPTSTGSTTGP